VFERFTDRARRVVVLAQEEARLLNHNYIGTEHILLGLLNEGEGIAANALESPRHRPRLGARARWSRSSVRASRLRGHIPFTPRAKKVLELSLREALQLGHNYIGTEHILLGLIREGEGVAAQVLQQLGAELQKVRQTVIQLLSGPGAARSSSPRNLRSAGRRRVRGGFGVRPSSTSSDATSPSLPATQARPGDRTPARSSGSCRSSRVAPRTIRC
jgi:ATP-dependent Clp protease ATP-binding subunit ClpC